MADERDMNNPQDNQEEGYNIPAPESKEFGSAPHTGGTESLMSLLQNKRLVMVVGGVIGIYIVLNIFSSSDAEIEQVAMDVPEVQPEQVIEIAPPEKTLSIFDSIDQDKEHKQKKNEDIDRLKTQITTLNRQSSEVKVRVKKLENKIDTLASQLAVTNTQLSKFAQIQEESKKDEKKKEVLQQYKIRAVISGRAWIEDSSGNNITVKVGDNIPTYGRITKIKPVEGVVETSSGRIITFGSHE